MLIKLNWKIRGRSIWVEIPDKDMELANHELHMLNEEIVRMLERAFPMMRFTDNDIKVGM